MLYLVPPELPPHPPKYVLYAYENDKYGRLKKYDLQYKYFNIDTKTLFQCVTILWEFKLTFSGSFYQPSHFTFPSASTPAPTSTPHPPLYPTYNTAAYSPIFEK